MSGATLILMPARAMRRSAIAWSVALGLLIFATVAFWPAFKGSALDSVHEQLPSGLVEALGMQNFGSPAGYLRGNLYELLVPLLASAAAIFFVNGATAADEDAGRLEIVLTQPVNRVAVFVARALAAAAWLIVIGVVVFVVQLISDAVFDLPIDTGRLAATVALCFLLGGLHGALATSIAGLAARPALVLGVSLAVAIFGYLVAALFPLSDALAGFAPLSPWNWAFAGDPLVNATDPWRYIGLAVPAMVLVALGALLFARRDVSAA
jgi:ABC-2 type transport system permease protein